MACNSFGFGVGSVLGDCGCPNCDIATDDGTPDESPLASPWAKQSGTNWSKSGGVIVAPAAADYTHTTSFPGGAADSRTEVVDVEFSTPGTVEVQTGKTDASNYFAAALTYNSSGCSILTAGVRGAGTGPLAALQAPLSRTCVQVWGLTTGVRYRLRVCLIPNVGSGYGYETYDKVIALITFPEDATRLPISCTLLVDGPAVR
ncbi:MAG: hypothetical protein IAF94_12595 [Pirellulaceae bacterium]|nr:hypothetical protein [Pirellulaceae bacterium]